MLNTPHRRRVTVNFGNKQMTKQNHKNECDINNILKLYKKTGVITHIQNQEPVFGDLPDEMDYQSALNIQLAADEAFASLPSVVRRAFDNDPSRLLAALGDPDMKPKLTELGILKAPDAPPRPPGNPENASPPPGVSQSLQTEPKLP